MKISIITASYNYAQYIEETIKSVLNQTYSDWELIIVDDGSSDNSVEIIKKFCEKDSRIKLFQHKNGQNRGLKETLMLGIEKSSGEWIAFLESDDVFKSNNLELKAEIINKYPQVKLIFNKIEFLWDEERRRKSEKGFNKRQNKLAKQKFPRNMFFDLYLENKILTFSSVMIEKTAIKKLDFDSPQKESLDWWLWIQLANKHPFYYINKELVIWRLHEKSYIATTEETPHNLSKKAYLKILKQKPNVLTFLYITSSEAILKLMKLKRSVKRRLIQIHDKTTNKT